MAQEQNVVQEKKGSLSGLGKALWAPFKWGGKALGWVGKTVGGLVASGVGLFSPKAEEWLRGMGRGIAGWTKNWVDKTKNQPALMEITNLKNKLTNMIMKFVIALHKSLVKEAKGNAQEIAENEDALRNKIGKGKDSILTGKVDEKNVSQTAEKGHAKDNVIEMPKAKGKSIDGLLSKAGNKANAINKTNHEFGLGGSTPSTRGLGRQ